MRSWVSLGPGSGAREMGGRLPIALWGSVVVVGVEERDQVVPSVLFGCVCPDVEPLVLHGAVEPLDLPVGARCLPLRAPVLDLRLRARRLPEPADVARAVVGQDRLHRDAVAGDTVM